MTKKEIQEGIEEVRRLFLQIDDEQGALKGLELIKKLLKSGQLTFDQEVELRGYGESFAVTLRRFR